MLESHDVTLRGLLLSLLVIGFTPLLWLITILSNFLCFRDVIIPYRRTRRLGLHVPHSPDDSSYLVVLLSLMTLLAI